MHIPVLLDEVIKYLNPKPNENFVDATFGEGGHSAAILEKTEPGGKILGIEADPELYEKFKAAELKMRNEELKSRLILVNNSYTNLKNIIKEYNFWPVNGILFDLGMSSWHLAESGRGFSFLRDEPLIMRYQFQQEISPSESDRQYLGDQTFQKTESDLTAAKIVNTWPEAKIEKILREYGEERWSRQIAKKIVEARKKKIIKTSFELAEIVRKAAPKKYVFSRLHPATRVFQALRIAINNELENLKIGLSQSLEILTSGGRAVVISFHSLEDRIVKNLFREKAKKGVLKILTEKPVIPTSEEIRRNPRARSAKLRAAIKM